MHTCLLVCVYVLCAHIVHLFACVFLCMITDYLIWLSLYLSLSVCLSVYLCMMKWHAFQPISLFTFAYTFFFFVNPIFHLSSFISFHVILSSLSSFSSSLFHLRFYLNISPFSPHSSLWESECIKDQFRRIETPISKVNSIIRASEALSLGNTAQNVT